MMKYLVIECDELGDQYECDANRTPLCITNDISKYESDYGYEIYEIHEDGSLSKIKEYEDVKDNWGMAIYFWKNEEDVESTKPDVVYEKFPQTHSDFFTTSKIKKIKEQYHLPSSVKEIKEDLECGEYATELNGGWFVIGDYTGSWYALGY